MFSQRCWYAWVWLSTALVLVGLTIFRVVDLGALGWAFAATLAATLAAWHGLWLVRWAAAAAAWGSPVVSVDVWARPLLGSAATVRRGGGSAGVVSPGAGVRVAGVSRGWGVDVALQSIVSLVGCLLAWTALRATAWQQRWSQPWADALTRSSQWVGELERAISAAVGFHPLSAGGPEEAVQASSEGRLGGPVRGDWEGRRRC